MLEEFKFIYWMEYAHRMWGRVLGLVFAGKPCLHRSGCHNSVHVGCVIQGYVSPITVLVSRTHWLALLQVRQSTFWHEAW